MIIMQLFQLVSSEVIVKYLQVWVISSKLWRICEDQSINTCLGAFHIIGFNNYYVECTHYILFNMLLTLNQHRIIILLCILYGIIQDYEHN